MTDSFPAVNIQWLRRGQNVEERMSWSRGKVSDSWNRCIPGCWSWLLLRNGNFFEISTHFLTLSTKLVLFSILLDFCLEMGELKVSDHISCIRQNQINFCEHFFEHSWTRSSIKNGFSRESDSAQRNHCGFRCFVFKIYFQAKHIRFFWLTIDWIASE